MKIFRLLVLPLMASGCFGQPTGDLFTGKVKPLLTRNCFGCHNAVAAQAGLDLTSRESLLRGSENGPVVTPGDPEASLLYKLAAHRAEPAMPFKGKRLSDEQVASLAEWIRAGVPYDGTAAPAARTEKPAASRSDHWAFRKPVRPPVPAGGSWRNPIDAFLARARSAHQLRPVAEANRRTLIRRMYLDLTGLPPSTEEVAAFLNDKSPSAYEKIIDRLLASPRYGERWGRHWLDVWRYSDWYGWRKENQVRYSQRHVWRWRDWVVESLNKNKGYDQMIVEMLAGDEVTPGDPDVLRATGYLARSWYRFNRNVWLQEAAEYTSASFLGLTMKCARCHSHKYDPVTHVDYYRFRAFFEPYEVRTDRVPGETDVDKAGLVRAFDAHLSAPTYRFIRGNESAPEKDKPLTAAVPAFFEAKLDIQPVSMLMASRYPDGREFVQIDLILAAEREIEDARESLAKARSAVEKLTGGATAALTWYPEETPAAKKARNDVTGAEKQLASAEAALPGLRARIAADRAKFFGNDAAEAERLAEEARRLERKGNVVKAEEALFHANLDIEAAKGDEKKLPAAKKRLEAAAKALGEASEGYTPIGTLYPETSSGRRLALARWIVSKDNPLAARVAVNHIWLRHFGKALVPTVFNFGRSGKAPSHPDLLDWLAVEFMESGWDMKRLHRLIVTSAAYRMASADTPDSPNAKIDPDNVYLWRMNPRRMEAEAVRDSIIFLTGKLDLVMGGPEIDETKGQEVFRRSLYFRHAPDLQMEMLKVFDLANPNECFERTESVMPQQALALANSTLGYSAARIIASKLGGGGPEQFVRAAFERVLGRPATSVETAESVRFLEQQGALFRNPAALEAFSSKESAMVKPAPEPDQRARESLVHVLLNHNDFVTIR